MSATDELRRMLTDAGMEWEAPASYDGSIKYDTVVDDYWFHGPNCGARIEVDE